MTQPRPWPMTTKMTTKPDASAHDRNPFDAM